MVVHKNFGFVCLLFNMLEVSDVNQKNSQHRETEDTGCGERGEDARAFSLCKTSPEDTTSDHCIWRNVSSSKRRRSYPSTSHATRPTLCLSLLWVVLSLFLLSFFQHSCPECE